jgi:hypothetical protein
MITKPTLQSSLKTHIEQYKIVININALLTTTLCYDLLQNVFIVHNKTTYAALATNLGSNARTVQLYVFDIASSNEKSLLIL